MDAWTLIGSAGGIGALIAALAEIGRRIRNRRTDQRIAHADADASEATAVQKFQAIWGEEFARLEQRVQNAEEDQARSRKAWERERVDLQRQVTHLEGVVSALRQQLVNADLTPSA